MNAVLRWARYGLDILGLATLFSIVASYIAVRQYDRQTGRRYTEAPPSPVAVEFARRVTPSLEAYVVAHKEPIVASAGGWPLRGAARLAFGAFVRNLGAICAAAMNAVLDIFGDLNIRQIAAYVLEHSRSRHRAVDPSVVAAARGAAP